MAIVKSIIVKFLNYCWDPWTYQLLLYYCTISFLSLYTIYYYYWNEAIFVYHITYVVHLSALNLSTFAYYCSITDSNKSIGVFFSTTTKNLNSSNYFMLSNYVWDQLLDCQINLTTCRFANTIWKATFLILLNHKWFT